MRALVLSGGGVKGAYQVGALKHLIIDKKVQYDILCGISVGALNCSFMSMFSKEDEEQALNELYGFWKTVNNDTIIKPWCPFRQLHAFWLSSMYNSQPLIDLIHERIDLEKVRASGRKVAVGAVSLTTGQYKSFTPDDDSFVDGVLASSSFPAGLKPIKIGNELYTDGGVKHITPLKEAIAFGATEIDVIICSPEMTTAPFKENSNALKLALRTIDLMTDEIINADLKTAKLYNKIAALDPSCGKKVVKLNILRPTADLTDDSLDFDNAKILEMMEKGYKDALSYNF